jgi:hypothetical protein
MMVIMMTDTHRILRNVITNLLDFALTKTSLNALLVAYRDVMLTNSLRFQLMIHAYWTIAR